MSESIMDMTVKVPDTGYYGTSGAIRLKSKKEKKEKITGIVAWIVKTFKPGWHLAKNPPKGNKRKVSKPKVESLNYAEPKIGG